MKMLVLLSVIVASALVADSCQGDRTQGKQTIQKIAKSVVETRSMRHDIPIVN
jgi:hypothetical protein